MSSNTLITYLRNWHLYLLVGTGFFLSHHLTAQSVATTAPQQKTETRSWEDSTLLNLFLPPLEIFLQTAETAPSVQRAEAFVKEQTHRLDATRKEWLNNFRLNTNYSYGSMGSMTESSATGQGTYFQYFGEEMSLYNVGGSITIPLDLFFGRQDRIKAGKAQIEQAKQEKALMIEQRKIAITELYAVAASQLRVLRANADANASGESTVKLSELEYLNGNLSFDEISRRKREYALAAASFEESKAMLFSTILRLELLTGIKLIK
ncbi:MAG: TolC family protein [Bacteroidales bacterium]|jgi:outer membrane protein TolC|nr:TolC family protein [Bacteroidales bacterium]OPZ96506.1 MAG: Outer membrane efflux protein [Bacteroidetes bacterium ADurb.Bin416]